jgi:hypothetical protein
MTEGAGHAVFDQMQQVSYASTSLGLNRSAAVVVVRHAGNGIGVALLGALGQATNGHGVKHALA